jgi:hypothetical protein
VAPERIQTEAKGFFSGRCSTVSSLNRLKEINTLGASDAIVSLYGPATVHVNERSGTPPT